MIFLSLAFDILYIYTNVAVGRKYSERERDAKRDSIGVVAIIGVRVCTDIGACAHASYVVDCPPKRQRSSSLNISVVVLSLVCVCVSLSLHWRR